MMNGAIIPRPYHQRKTIDARTMPASHAHAGTRRALSTKLDLGEAPRELGRLCRAGLDPDAGRGAHDVAQHRVGDSRPSHRLLERGNVELCGPVDVVVAPDEVECSGGHRRTRALVAGEQLER